MQKIIMILLVFGITNSYGQSRGEPTKSLTVAEANKLNGVANPTINGIPYSQFKAQQDALKNQKTNAPKVQTDEVVTINANDVRPAQVKPQAPVTKFENDGYSEVAVPVVKGPADVTKQEKKPGKTATPDAVIKDASADPVASPKRPAIKTADVQVPVENSGNTGPAINKKQGG